MASIPQSVRSWSDGEKSPAHGTAARSSGATPQSHNAAEPQRHDRLAAFIKLSRYCGSALDEI
ncbi:hypothetical protein BN889_03970 [Pseudomonas aeruginosa PA38182]|nr:hypothetical protein BN889_03970 [Pseudomonas aeruginosa PA38182]